MYPFKEGDTFVYISDTISYDEFIVLRGGRCKSLIDGGIWKYPIKKPHNITNYKRNQCIYLGGEQMQ